MLLWPLRARFPARFLQTDPGGNSRAAAKIQVLDLKLICKTMPWEKTANTGPWKFLFVHRHLDCHHHHHLYHQIVSVLVWGLRCHDSAVTSISTVDLVEAVSSQKFLHHELDVSGSCGEHLHRWSFLGLLLGHRWWALPLPLPVPQALQVAEFLARDHQQAWTVQPERSMEI